MTDRALVKRLLDAIEHDILPKTAAGVADGNKVFGAAILRKSDLSTVIAETNNELENPLWHGEMHALKRFYELPAHARPNTSDCLFLTTHEPCSLCLSAITWTGFDNFWFLFSHQDSRDDFAIPHDLKILKEVFTLDPGGYNLQNAFWTGHSLTKTIAAMDDDHKAALLAQADRIRDSYAALSKTYQASKQGNDIPLN